MYFDLLIFLISIILILFLSQQLFKNTLTERPVIDRSVLHTGDLIFFAGNMSRYTPNIVGIEHTHAALVLREADGQLKIVELTSDGDLPESDAHPIIHDFNRRVDDYHGYASIKRISNPLPNHLVRAAFNDLKTVEFDYCYTSNFLKQWAIGSRREPNGKWCCSEFVYMTLVKLGVLNYDYHNFHDSFRFLSALRKCDDGVTVYGDFVNLKK